MSDITSGSQERFNGRVKWFNNKAGYGFVTVTNGHHLDKDIQYSFYLNSLRKRKRYSPWIYKDKIKDLDCVKSYYGYSNEKAKQALRVLTKEQLNFIKSKIETGGKNNL